MSHVQAFTALILQRLAREGLAPGSPIAVAELHRRLVPYALCREALGLTTKAEYDLALLRLLVDDSIEVEETALREAVHRELDSPEPGLAILQRFAASEVRLGAGNPPATGETRSDEPAEAMGPAPADYETERMAQDRIPGLDDQEFRPERGEPAAPESPPTRAVTPVPSDRSEPGEWESAAGGGLKCRSCNVELPPRAGLKFCPACGANQQQWPCSVCGERVERGWKFCAMCGSRQRD